MKRTILIAKKNFLKKKIPIGAILINNNFEIGIGINIKLYPFMHAEIIALKQGFFYLSKNNTKNLILYTTLEPCFICLSNLFYCKISMIVFASYYKNIKKKSKLKMDFYNFQKKDRLIDKNTDELFKIFFLKKI